MEYIFEKIDALIDDAYAALEHGDLLGIIPSGKSAFWVENKDGSFTLVTAMSAQGQSRICNNAMK